MFLSKVRLMSFVNCDADLSVLANFLRGRPINGNVRLIWCLVCNFNDLCFAIPL